MTSTAGNPPTKMKTLSTQSSTSRNIFTKEHIVTRINRGMALGRGFRGCTLWFTGLSGAGKTTISFALEKYLIEHGIATYSLDGDNIRTGLNKNLGFSESEREENIRRIAEVAKLFADAGLICTTSFISPFARDRERARRLHQDAALPFFEIFVDTPLEECEKRDTKGLYEKARKGLIKGFTGIDQEYEAPTHPDLVLSTQNTLVHDCVERIVEFLSRHHILPGDSLTHQFVNLIIDPVTQQGRTRIAVGRCVAQRVPRIELTRVDMEWLQILSEGWASPLRSFMDEREYLQALHFGCLYNEEGFTNQSIPIVLAITHEKRDEIAAYLQADKAQQDKEDEDKKEKAGEGEGQIINKYDPWMQRQRRQSVTQADQCFTKPAEEEAAANEETEQQFSEEDEAEAAAGAVGLWYAGKPVAILRHPELFAHNKTERCARTFGTLHKGHPVVRAILDEAGDWLIGGGRLEVFERIMWEDGLDELRLSPLEIKHRLKRMEADAVFAFQLRNPIHNGHAMLMKDTRTHLLAKGYKNPVLLLHPLGGWTKDDDVPLPVRIAQHRAILEARVLDPETTLMAIFPSPMLYAGPTEVQWHAKARLATGAQFYIVGRDPAGIGNPDPDQVAKLGRKDLYDITHGSKILTMAPGLRELEIIPFRVAAYNRKHGRMEYFDESRAEEFEFISGTRMRQLGRSGETPPSGYMETSAWKVLAEFFNSKSSS